MSKSGLFAHFGSKEQLQLATIDAAEEIFDDEVLRPALEVEGLARLGGPRRALPLARAARGVPGGCFFASVAAEIDTGPGPVRDRVVGVYAAWTGLMEDAVRTAGSAARPTPRSTRAQLASRSTRCSPRRTASTC